MKKGRQIRRIRRLSRLQELHGRDVLPTRFPALLPETGGPQTPDARRWEGARSVSPAPCLRSSAGSGGRWRRRPGRPWPVPPDPGSPERRRRTVSSCRGGSSVPGPTRPVGTGSPGGSRTSPALRCGPDALLRGGRGQGRLRPRGRPGQGGDDRRVRAAGHPRSRIGGLGPGRAVGHRRPTRSASAEAVTPRRLHRVADRGLPLVPRAPAAGGDRAARGGGHPAAEDVPTTAGVRCRRCPGPAVQLPPDHDRALRGRRGRSLGEPPDRPEGTGRPHRALPGGGGEGAASGPRELGWVEATGRTIVIRDFSAVEARALS